jgi:hypothetical protein
MLQFVYKLYEDSKMSNINILKIALIITIFLISGSSGFARHQTFISIEPHMGYAGSNIIYFGGKVYNYDGIKWTRKPYYSSPALIAEFNNKKIDFNPDSEGYFWVQIPIEYDTKLNYGSDNLNYISVSLDKKQNNENKNLILVTDFGLNTDKIVIPFLALHPDSKFCVVSDFDNTITHKRGLGIIGQLTNNPEYFRIRNQLKDTYIALHNDLNPFFYLSARPNGTYKVVKEFIENNELPTGPILLRNLGFWFVDKGITPRAHKLSSLSQLMNTFSGKRFILIGDDSHIDKKVYSEIQEKYPKRVIKIFIISKNPSKKKDTEIINYVSSPHEILEDIKETGLLD